MFYDEYLKYKIISFMGKIYIPWLRAYVAGLILLISDLYFDIVKYQKYA